MCIVDFKNFIGMGIVYINQIYRKLWKLKLEIPNLNKQFYVYIKIPEKIYQNQIFPLENNDFFSIFPKNININIFNFFHIFGD